MTTARLSAATTAALLTLAGCSEGSPQPLPAAPPAAMEPDCGANMLDSYIGLKATDSVIATIQQWRREHPVRVLKPGSIVTMDFRPDRLNIDLDENDLITGFRCT